jgi:hypothetical protein
MAYDPGMSDDVTRYELRITATGEVRDEHGNLLNQEPIEATRILTETEAAEFLAQQAEEQE